jgi:hypothetical protein
MRGREALCLLFEDPLNKELLLSSEKPLAMLVCRTSVCCSIETRTECGFRYIICAMRSSDWIDLSCTDRLKSPLDLKLALSHSDVVVC